jgi:hypothetical protein
MARYINVYNGTLVMAKAVPRKYGCISGVLLGFVIRCVVNYTTMSRM